MKIIEPKAEIVRPQMTPEAIDSIYRIITYCGNKSYMPGKEITPDYARRFVRERVKEGHESVLEHAVMTVEFTVDRGVSHELVRHRLTAITQESSRYVNYSKDKFGNELTFIKPLFWDEGSNEYAIWQEAMQAAEDAYMKLVNGGCKPEEARSVLPNSVKTTVCMTANFREWRTIFKLRTAGTTGKPHPQMVEVMLPLLWQCQELMPEIFDDIKVVQ